MPKILIVFHNIESVYGFGFGQTLFSGKVPGVLCWGRVRWCWHAGKGGELPGKRYSFSVGEKCAFELVCANCGGVVLQVLFVFLHQPVGL